MKKETIKQLVYMLAGISLLIVLVWLMFLHNIACSGSYGQPNCTMSQAMI